MNLFITDTAINIDSSGGNYILAKKSTGKKTIYRVKVELEGNDLPFVKEVKYILHKTFKNNQKLIERTLSNPNCRLVFYAWGTFTIIAKIETLKGDVYQITHPLQFGKEIQSGNFQIKY